jgi:hypothetical protein
LELVDDEPQMVGGSAAATADEADLELFDHLAETAGHRFGLHRENGETVDVDRDTGVGDDGNGFGGVLAEVAGGFAHVVGAGGAVETDDVNGKVFEDVEGGGDVGAEEHAAGGVEGDGAVDGEVFAGFFADAEDGVDGGFEFEDVLDGFDDEDVGAAVDETADLIEEEIDDLLESVLTEHRVLGGGEETGGADGAGDEAGVSGGAVVLRDAAGEFGGGAIELVGLVAEAVFLQLDFAAAEGVGFEDVDAGVEVAGVDVFDDGGVDEDEVVVAALFAAVVFGSELEVEDGGAHGAVVDEDALAGEVEELAHLWLYPGPAARGGRGGVVATARRCESLVVSRQSSADSGHWSDDTLGPSTLGDWRLGELYWGCRVGTQEWAGCGAGSDDGGPPRARWPRGHPACPGLCPPCRIPRVSTRGSTYEAPPGLRTIAVMASAGARKRPRVFRRRVMRREFGGLFDEPVRRILAEAVEEKVLDQGPRGCPGGDDAIRPAVVELADQAIPMRWCSSGPPLWRPPRVPFRWSPFDLGFLFLYCVAPRRRRRIQRVERQDHHLPRLRPTLHVYGGRAGVLPGAWLHRTPALRELPR